MYDSNKSKEKQQIDFNFLEKYGLLINYNRDKIKTDNTNDAKRLN